MKRSFLLLMLIFTLAVPAWAVPGAFDFDGANPIPDGTVISAPLMNDVTFNTGVPSGADTVTWYVWEGPTPGTTGEALTSAPLTLDDNGTPGDAGDDFYTFTLAAATVNGLPDGVYSWDIIASDMDGDTSITGAPFTFTINFVFGLDGSGTNTIPPAFIPNVAVPTTLTFTVEALPPPADDAEFRLYAGDAIIPGNEILTALDSTDGSDGVINVDLTPLQPIASGEYAWTIVALETGESDVESIDEGPFFFYVLPSFAVTGGSAPGNGAVLFNTQLPANVDVVVEQPYPTDYEDAEFRLWLPNQNPMMDPPAVATRDSASGTDGIITPIMTGSLSNGLYTWTVFLIDNNSLLPEVEATGFPYTFTVSDPTTTALFPPNGATLTTPLEAIVFTGEDGGEWYNVRLRDASDSVVFEGWVAASVAGNTSPACTADGTLCTIYPRTGTREGQFFGGPVIFGATSGLPTEFPTLFNGDYTLDFAVWDGTEVGDRVGESTFTLNVPVVANGATVFVEPNGVGVERAIVWVDDPGVLWYSMEVTDANNNMVFQPVTPFGAGYDYSSAYCQGGTCTVDIPALADGTYTVTVYAWGPANEAVAMTTEDFTISRTEPAPVTLTSPMNGATVTAGTVDLTFDDNVSNTWLRIQIVNPASNVVSSEWVDSADICNGMTCTYTVDLPAGGYNVWISGWNATAGFGDAGATAFTVSE